MPSMMREVGIYTVNYGDVDQNRHMNNTRYPDMYSTFLPLEGKRIRTLSINYRSEARSGEKLRVELAEGVLPNSYYIRTVREDGVINTEAEALLEEI
jgi:acyl-ACP thioesterase